MSKHISAGDTLTVGDLTDDHLGAVIEVGPVNGFTTRLELKALSDYTPNRYLWSTENDCKGFRTHDPVTVIAPPPVVQPDEPTELGQCIRIEGDTEVGVFVGHGRHFPFLYPPQEWLSWGEVLDRAGARRIIVSDPPRWPDETPVVPERIDVGEWPDDDTHLREWEWVDRDGERWKWYLTTDKRTGAWRYYSAGLTYPDPTCGPWTRGGRVE